MKQRVIIFIIVLTTISLIAALITQLLWVRGAWLLKEDQFTNSVDVALKSVVNQLLSSENSLPINREKVDPILYQNHIEIFSSVNPDQLDSLIRAEFGSLRINRDFKYGVYNVTDGTFIMGNYDGFQQQLLDSPHWRSLTCLCQAESYNLAVYFPRKSLIITNQMIVLPVMSGIFLLILVFSFFFTIYSLLRQKKLDDVKTDFVNNMTHEFKTPISTISISSEMLMKEEVISSPEKIKKYASIIFDENTRLKSQVERVLQIAILDREDFNVKLTALDVHDLINNCIDNFRVVVNERKGTLSTHLNAQYHTISADKEHVINIFNNLLDNANKYSPENPTITVNTSNVDGWIKISVEDNGIGIRKDSQHEIFKKFQRLQTGDIHDVKGFGIGLFYVKTMVEKMGGTIDIKSERNKGSQFIISFPV